MKNLFNKLKKQYILIIMFRILFVIIGLISSAFAIVCAVFYFDEHEKVKAIEMIVYSTLMMAFSFMSISELFTTLGYKTVKKIEAIQNPEESEEQHEQS